MIESTKNATVKRVARLKQRPDREATGLALMEGPQVVRELIAHAASTVEELFFTSDGFGRHPELAEAATAAGIEVEFVTDAVLAAMADTRTPQGVLAVAHQTPTRLREALPEGTRLVAVLDEVRDPGNAGTVIRAADAAGADVVILTGSSVDPYNPKVVRATTGSLFHLSVVTGVTIEAAAEEVRAAGLSLLAADMGGEPLPATDLSGPTAWLFGNEAHGLSDTARALADRTVAVPIYGKAESLNLGTAAAVCLYASAFAHRA
ncbi:TrmH family RNA methyltransferase [Amnibacterium kyonggiense]|uniref:TrmH family RNA methyltransferase n=1 Tax=Amnibacterium kyonggiense TaxID=595671 RepID=A0A4R7FFG8_9MICO|nr:RNA methyltransferase [Amnibacterium kyonggiense]TDS75580.1 TrmH family RNA methyltransferase [Amnibacterium kyonggiense]